MLSTGNHKYLNPAQECVDGSAGVRDQVAVDVAKVTPLAKQEVERAVETIPVDLGGVGKGSHEDVRLVLQAHELDRVRGLPGGGGVGWEVRGHILNVKVSGMGWVLYKSCDLE